MHIFFKGTDAEETVVDAAVSRRLLGYGGDLMMTEVAFAKGGIGAPHSHAEHEQISRVMSGSFEATVGGEKRVLKGGDVFYAARGVVHGVVALEDSVILDVFTPIRRDFL